MRINCGCHAHCAIFVNFDSVQIGMAIRRELMRRGDTQESAAHRFGVKQSSVCRVLGGQFTQRSTLAGKMREHYLDQIDGPQYAHNQDAALAFAQVVEALSQIWDGTVEGAARLRSLVETVRWLKEGH